MDVLPHREGLCAEETAQCWWKHVGLVAGLCREPRAGNFYLKTATGGVFAAGAQGRRGVLAARTLPDGCSGLEVARPRVPGDFHYLIHPASYPMCT